MQIMEMVSQLSYSQTYYIVLTPLVFMLIDILTGFFYACQSGEVKSGKMREGLYKKGTEILIILGVLYFQFVLSIGEFHIAEVVSTYVTFSEVISILENAAGIGVPVPEFILNVFHKTQEEINSGDIFEE